MYEIGRFAVVGEHEEEPDGYIVIRLFPHTSLHAYPWWSETTQNILKRLPDLHGKQVLDFGCGASCILGLAAAHLGADVVALDEQPELVEIAHKQVEANGFSFPVLVEDDGQLFDFILANVGDAHLVGQLSIRSEHGIGTAIDGELIEW